ncbi:MAG: hypothetical protein ABI378_15990 [Chitinophagaceae bacterium]
MKKTFLLPVIVAPIAALRAGAGFFAEAVLAPAFYYPALLAPIRR